MKKKICLIIILIAILLNGCGKTKVQQEWEEWEAQQDVEYIYEDVEAFIRDIDVKYSAIHDYYQWSISIYCMPPYDLDYAEINSGGNQFNPPSFIEKVKGDTVTVEICNVYINGSLNRRNVVKIK